MGSILKIVLTGPESSGKSELGRKLAEHFGKVYIPEYARIYLEKHGPNYDHHLLKKLAQKHLQHQESYLQRASDFAFLDTDLINYRIWEKLVFGEIHHFIEDKIEAEQDHRYLITYPDIPWQPDPLRENPESREEIFGEHLYEIQSRKRPYAIIRGEGSQRLQNAITATQELLGR